MACSCPGAHLRRHNRWVISRGNAPAMMLNEMPSVSQILYLVWMVSDAINPSDEVGRRMSKGIMSCVSLSVATNVMTTGLIIARLMGTYRQTSRAFHDRMPPRMYSTVVAVIVESAAPLAFFGICLVITRSILIVKPPEKPIPRGRLQVFDVVSNGLYSSFCVSTFCRFEVNNSYLQTNAGPRSPDDHRARHRRQVVE